MQQKGYIQENKTVIGFGGNDVKVQVIDRNKAITIIKQHHYSKTIINNSYIHLGVYSNNTLVGVMQYGYALQPAKASSVVKNTGNKEYLELNRMWFENNLSKNLKSKAVSYSIKYIKKAYPAVKWIQSFADQRCNKLGIVYQACNFNYYGAHSSLFYKLQGKYYHKIHASRYKGKGIYLQDNIKKATKIKFMQFRYIFFIKKKYKKDCLKKEQPYPKHYKE